MKETKQLISRLDIYVVGLESFSCFYRNCDQIIWEQELQCVCLYNNDQWVKGALVLFRKMQVRHVIEPNEVSLVSVLHVVISGFALHEGWDISILYFNVYYYPHSHIYGSECNRSIETIFLYQTNLCQFFLRSRNAWQFASLKHFKRESNV